MKTLQFKCTLLSNVVLNAIAATEGEQTTLDFIPGNNFLGIVAKEYDTFSQVEQMEIFHSGKVRFGDAHPTIEGSTIRSLHVPANFFYPKGKTAYEDLYVFQSYSRATDIAQSSDKPMQLKQCRSGYYVFQGHEGKSVPVEKSFAIKSAYDREQRRSADKQMYGYESLDKGQAFLFEVEADDDGLASRIHDALIGTHHIGRSRTAQYGLVKIEEAAFNDIPSGTTAVETIRGKRVAVYADSRLVFLDDSGQPLPVSGITADKLGLDGKIDWNVSQVRTFQYAPWNGKRQTRDADRCGIEKGSVIFVDSKSVPSASRYVGSYKNEGFGRVIYNPDFLRCSGGNGNALYHLIKADEGCANKTVAPLHGTPLLDFVKDRKDKYEAEIDVMDKVNYFVDQYGHLFKGQSFASQWGSIRSIAMAHPTKKEILNELFDKTEQRWHYPSPNDQSSGNKPIKTAYLIHGVASNRWDKQQRKEKLRSFINNVNDNYVQQAVVTLASEMAKICTRNGKD